MRTLEMHFPVAVVEISKKACLGREETDATPWRNSLSRTVPARYLIAARSLAFAANPWIFRYTALLPKVFGGRYATAIAERITSESGGGVEK
ncbi:MAG: hypothetical protein H7Z74_05290 [Anaerolineae bacterium]|nr:hypothetical protein [Gemmatimonadaceae bacterium]